MICPNCKNQVDEGIMICPKCGRALPVAASDAEPKSRKRAFLRYLAYAWFAVASVVLTYEFFYFKTPRARYGGSLQSLRDAITNDLNNLGANAYQYRIRPKSMGGGQGTYVGYLIPTKISSNENGTYSCMVYQDTILFTAIAVSGEGDTIRVRLDDNGKLLSWEYLGNFQR